MSTWRVRLNIRSAGLALLVSAAAVLAARGGAAADAATPQLVSATFVGTAGPDDFQGVAIAADGTIFVAGNLDQPLAAPAGVASVTLGQPVADTWYRCGFVGQFSADGKKLLRMAQFARGQVFLTSVAVANDSVYVGGYAVPQCAPLFQALKGVFPTAQEANAAPLPWPLPGDPVRAKEPAVSPDEPHVLTLLTRAHGSKGGIPCVLRLDTPLAKLTGGTYLEGEHYAWNIDQQLKEDEWTPTAIGLLADGSLVVGHDGGVPAHYYYAPDYVSRLAPDLTQRIWRFDLYFPMSSLDRIRKYQAHYEPRIKEWRVPIFGQTRLLQVRTNGKDAIYVCGWSVSATSKEPWWVPFLYKLNPNGDVAWRAFSFDPMSGGGDRVTGDVADSVIRNVALTEEADVLISGLADGGNTVLRKNPLNYDLAPQAPLKGEMGRRPTGGGGERYKGFTLRMTDRLESKGGLCFGAGVGRGTRPAWAVDLCALPGNRVLCLGRHNYEYPTSASAWSADTETPGAFLRLFDENYKDLFLTNLPDVTPYALAVQGSRVVVVGLARSDKSPTKDAVFPKQAGNFDAYLLVGDFPLPPAPK